MKLKVESLTPLKKALEALNELPEKMTALELAAIIRRAENMLEGLQEQLVVEANQDYLKLTANEPGRDAWRMADGSIIVTGYTPRCSWVYPNLLVAAAADLSAKQKAAQLDKTAKKVTPKLDPKTDKIYMLHSESSFARFKANANGTSKQA